VTADEFSVAQRGLVQRLRAALVPLLTEGSWNQIEDDHRKAGLTWRPEIAPTRPATELARDLCSLASEPAVAITDRGRTPRTLAVSKKSPGRCRPGLL
jgi:hypothetical protein